MKFSKNNAKFIRSLQLKKYRDKFNNFVAEGDKICKEILSNRQLKIKACFISPAWLSSYPDLLAPYSAIYELVSPAQMKQLSGLKNPTEILIVAEKPNWRLSDISLEGKWSIYLDGIQDPGNLGTILRIADWFGWAAVFCSSDTTDLYNPKVIQSTMGAILRVPVLKVALSELKSHYENPTIYGAALDGENAFKIRSPERGILVIGNEGKGIRSETASLMDRSLHIPKGANAGAESLNAAVACGILCACLDQF